MHTLNVGSNGEQGFIQIHCLLYVLFTFPPWFSAFSLFIFLSLSLSLSLSTSLWENLFARFNSSTLRQIFLKEYEIEYKKETYLVTFSHGRHGFARLYTHPDSTLVHEPNWHWRLIILQTVFLTAFIQRKNIHIL